MSEIVAQKKLKSSDLMVFSNGLLEKMSAFAKATELELTEKAKQRLLSGARNAYMVLQENGLTPYDLDINNVMNVFQQVAFLPITPNTHKAQSYFQVRKAKGKTPTLEYNLQGDGWETLLNVYGKDVESVQSWVIREGDYFSGIEYHGMDVVPPTMKFATNKDIVEQGLNKHIRKVENVVFAIKTTSRIEYISASREDIKANIIAQARNNGASIELQRELANYSVDEILSPDGKFLEMTIKNTYGYSNNLFSPTYRSPANVEGMIITKLKKYICTRYTLDFDQDPENRNKGVIIQEVYQQTLEEDNYQKPVVSADGLIQEADDDYDDNANVEIRKQGEPFEVRVSIKDTIEVDDNGVVVEEEEETVEVEENNEPDWM